jgi:hypothetical protein
MDRGEMRHGDAAWREAELVKDAEGWPLHVRHHRQSLEPQRHDVFGFFRVT